MGIKRENGYSASIEGFLVVGGTHYRLAKTNGACLVLVEECELAPATEGHLLIIVDGVRDWKRIEIPLGMKQGERCVEYVDPDVEPLPF